MAGYHWKILWILLCGCACSISAGTDNFVVNGKRVPLYGVYEVAIEPDVLPEDPVLPALKCVFTGSASGEIIQTVDCFGTGDGKIRARTYVDRLGEWSWQIVESDDMDKARASGTFKVKPSQLPGRLLPDKRNPRHWMRENGKWFLNLNDTAYFLLSPVDNAGAPISDDQARAYVRDAMDHGITSFRSFPPTGSLRLGSHLEGGMAYLNSVFGDQNFREPNLANYAAADKRMRMLLDSFPEACLQFIILPLASAWGQDEPFWQTLPQWKRDRLLRYVIARFAAYPQIFWLVENDAHYGAKNPLNNALAREVGQYLQAHDPWQHPRSTGPARGVPFIFAEEDWATYIHLERRYDLNARAVSDYQHVDKPVFHGEDYYEQDRERNNPLHMQYFQRRLFWTWLMSGASANYGSRWCYLHPYSQTGTLTGKNLWAVIQGGEGENSEQMPDYAGQMVGLDSVRFIPGYFGDRQLELPSFEPAPALVRNLSANDVEAPPKLMRMGTEAFLVYHPNALVNGKAAMADPDAAAAFEIDLSGATGARFSAEWFHCGDGRSKIMSKPLPGGATHSLTAPWMGTDVVLYLKKL